MHHLGHRFHIIHKQRGTIGYGPTRQDAFIFAEEWKDGEDIEALTVFDSMANIGNSSTWQFIRDAPPRYMLRRGKLVKTHWTPTGTRPAERF